MDNFTLPFANICRMGQFLLNSINSAQPLELHTITNRNGSDQRIARQRLDACNNRTGLCNPFLGNGSVNTFPRIDRAMQRGDVINNRLFSVRSVQSADRRSEFTS
jgi:hypothetical protein